MPETSFSGGGLNVKRRMVVCEFRALDECSSSDFKTVHETHILWSTSVSLFFPNGTDGWNPTILQQKSRRQVTARLFYSTCIMKKMGKLNILHFGVVYSSIAASINLLRFSKNRRSYNRHNQSDLRAGLYQGLADAVKTGDANRAGKRFTLPGSFTGSLRLMATHYHDAMAIVREIGKRLVTFNCNP